MTTTLIIIAIIIAVIVIVSLAIGYEMNIERNITINKPLNEVFNYLKYTRNQDNFSVWNMTDPTMNKSYVGTDATIGFIYSWDSTNKNVGAGEQEIKNILDGMEIEYELRFKRPMQNVAKSSFVFKAVSATETNVQWGFYSKMKFPMNIMKSMFTKMLGKDLEKSLVNLKVILEK